MARSSTPPVTTSASNAPSGLIVTVGAAKVGWEVLLNRSGTTFRKLPDADRADLDQAKAVELMLAQPSMIKRPVVETGGELLVGFKPDVYEKAFG